MPFRKFNVFVKQTRSIENYSWVFDSATVRRNAGFDFHVFPLAIEYVIRVTIFAANFTVENQGEVGDFVS
jgi:hypothetical protein